MLKIRCLIGREKLVAYDWLMPAKERMLENFNAQIYAQNEKIVSTESQEDMLLHRFWCCHHTCSEDLFNSPLESNSP